jgi:hypothetical protein
VESARRGVGGVLSALASDRTVTQYQPFIPRSAAE